jgi:signal transduction histidine kinase
MATLYSPQNRAERLIASGRVVLAAGSLFAVWLDPTQPAKHAEIGYSLLVVYVVYSSLTAALVTRLDASRNAPKLVTQAFDLVFFSTFVYFTAGPSSPFIAYFVFSLVCGTLRWGWLGAFWTATASLTSFLGLGAWFAYVPHNPPFDLNPFIIHAVYFAVVAVLLGYLGAHEERSRREISQLSDWPREQPREITQLASELLSHACRVVESPGAALAWSEREEPWLYVASSCDFEFEYVKLDPASMSPLVAEALESDGFLSTDLRASTPAVLRSSGSARTRWRGHPLHAELVEKLDIHGVIAAPLPGETLSGWIFFIDKPGAGVDDLELSKIVAGIVAARLDLHYLARQLHESAATEERIRLARDLHDGILQSLTGIALRLAATERQVAEDPEAAVGSIEETRRLIALEQQDLRFFIEDLRPPPPGSGGDQRDLRERLQELAQRAEQEWNLQVELPAGGTRESIPDALVRELYLIVREALVNAVRHGGASRVVVRTADSSDGHLVVEIADNGRGFPFEGTYSHADLDAGRGGPRSISERVASLRGALTVESNRSGARLRVELPLRASRA